MLWVKGFQRNSFPRFEEFEQTLATFSVLRMTLLKEFAADLECAIEGPRRRQDAQRYRYSA